MKPKFKVGDYVLVNKNILLPGTDYACVSTNQKMKGHVSQKTKLQITRVVTNLNGNYTCYDLDDEYIYNENWLSLYDPALEVIYHSNPKIHNVIVKIKSLQKQRKEDGYVY